MKKVSLTLQRYSKFIAALVGVATEAVNLGYVPHSAQNGVTIAISVLTALGVVGVSNGPAMADGVGIANDVASLKEQIGPLKNLNGWQKAVAWLHGHGSEVVAIVEAAKTDVEDLLHHGQQVATKPPVSLEPPTTAAAPVTLTQPGDVQVTTEPPTVAEPTATTPAATGNTDAVAELATLIGVPHGS